MKRIIAIAADGKQSGKTTVANYLKDKGHRVYSFATLIKQMALPLLQTVCSEQESYDILFHSDKTQECFFIDGVSITARHILQTLGTEWGRKCLHENIWPALLMQQIINDDADYVVIDDLRFLNEMEYLKRYSGATDLIFVKVKRPGNDNNDNHPSEQILPDENFNIIINNTGTLEDLKQETIKIVEEKLDYQQLNI